MAVTVLVLQVMFVVAAFGLRTAVQVARTGDTGLRRPQGATARTASALMTLGGLGAGLAAALAATDALEPWTTGAAPTGIALVAAGAALAVAAQFAMGRSWRVGVDPEERTDLVTAGLFGLVRNPIFTGMALTAVGTALALPTPLSLAAAAVMVAGAELQVRRVEEPYLARTHGEAYADYCRRAGRFVPRLGLR
jgi:protein-S-isoprenylcysteine O-methyltransferase Ste14